MRTPHRRARLRACAFAKRHVTLLSRITRYITTAIVPMTNNMPRKSRRLRTIRQRGAASAASRAAVSGCTLAANRVHPHGGSVANSMHPRVAEGTLTSVSKPQRISRSQGGATMRVYLISPTHYNADGSLHRTTRYWTSGITLPYLKALPPAQHELSFVH